MARFFFHNLPRRERNCSQFILAFSWLSGLLCGAFALLSADNRIISLMRSVALAPVSIVGLLCAILFPFLFSASAVYFSKPGWLFPISFGKAFLFAYVSTGIVQAFGSAGWLIRFLLLFGNCASIPVLYWFWLRHLPGCRRSLGWEDILAISITMLIGSVHYRIIVPFLALLIDSSTR